MRGRYGKPGQGPEGTMTRLIPTVVALLILAAVACSEQGLVPSSPTAPSSAPAAKPGGHVATIPLTTSILDVDASGIPADISSDGGGGYLNGVGGVTSFLTENGYNGIEFGDWQFNTKNSTTRAVGHSFDESDAVQSGDPRFIVAANPPYWGTEVLKTKMEVKCTLLNHNMLTMSAGASFTCPLLNSMIASDGRTWGLHPALSFTGFPETTDVEVTCNAANSGGCSDWYIDPINLGQAVGRLTRQADKRNQPNTNEGAFYMRFRIHLVRP
jgi:hypothetical protein